MIGVGLLERDIKEWGERSAKERALIKRDRISGRICTAIVGLGERDAQDILLIDNNTFCYRKIWS